MEAHHSTGVSQVFVGSLIEVLPTIVSPNAIEIMSIEFSNDSGENNNAMDNDLTANGNTDVLRLTPSVVIGKIVGPGSLFLGRSDSKEALGEKDEVNSLVIGIVPKSLESCKCSLSHFFKHLLICSESVIKIQVLPSP